MTSQPIRPSERLTWHELATAPPSPGVYAWYFRPAVAQFDVDLLVNQLNGLTESSQRLRAILQFLSAHLLEYFKDSRYEVQIAGSLKPRYSGYVQHQQVISPSLLERISANPHRLQALKAVLEYLTPEFTAPLYIGMAQKLSQRLLGHKRLIEDYLEGRQPHIEVGDDTQQRDHSFAQEVCARRMPPTALFVEILPIDDLADVVVDVENLLNRINHPILGRN